MPGIGKCQAGMGQGVIRRERHRLLHQVDRLVHFLLATDRIAASFQIQAIGLRIGCRAVDQLGFFLATQLAADGLRDGGGDLAFDLQHVVRPTAVLFAPKLGGVADAHQFGSDGQARSPLYERAEHDAVNTELAADFHRIHLLAFEGECRCPRDDTQPTESGKFVNQTL